MEINLPESIFRKIIINLSVSVSGNILFLFTSSKVTSIFLTYIPHYQVIIES